MAQNLLPKITCPHCWHRFHTEDVLWVAAHPDLFGDPVLGDDALARFLPTRFTPTGEAVDRRGASCSELACPNCHLSIPRALLEHDYRILSVVGTPGCGKSYFLTSSIWHLRHLLARKFAVSMADADPVGNAEFTAQEQQLFLQEDPKRLVYLEKTQLEGGHYDSVQLEPGRGTLLPKPHLFSVRPSKQHVNARGARELTELLCLYDNAGEHFLPGSESVLSPTTKHLAQSRNVMFVFDPMQDVRFRSRLKGASSDPQITSHSKAFRQDTVLLEVAARIRRDSGLGSDDKLKQSLTVIVSKSDVWGRLLSDEDIRTDPYLADTRADGAVLGRIDKDRVERVSARIEHLMQETVPEFVIAASESAQRVLYVPVSATGCSPHIEQSSGMMKFSAGELQPWWVTVPFVYEISRWGKLIGSQRAKESAGKRSES